MNVVMLRKGNATYACDTEERLKRFKAAGWEEIPPAQPAGDGAKQSKRQPKKKTTEKAE